MFAVPSASRAQQPTVAADAFVDSVGVNLHLHFFGTPYEQWPVVHSRILELGVRHVRDGVIDTQWPDYYQRFETLAQAGIKATLIVAPGQSTELWASYPARMPRAFEAYEGPNELDKSGDRNWAAAVRETMVRLRSLRNDPRSARFPVFGPSLSTAESYLALGDVSQYFDAASIHNYLGGRYPGTTGWGWDGYGSIRWSINLASAYAGGKPIVATENGYHNTGTADAIPQQVAGRYMPRLLIAQYLHGIERTYIYELVDWAGSGSYGLLNQDLSPKPAFTAVSSLLNLLSDPGPAFTPENLAYTVSGGTGDVRHMVFQKRDGTYYLAIWIEAPSFHNEERRLLTVPTQNVTLSLARPMRVVRTHHWQPDGSLATSAGTHSTKTFPIEVSDALTVIELAATGESGGGGAPDAPDLSATVSDRDVYLRWEPSGDAIVLTGYIIEASASSDFSNPFRAAVGPVTELAVPNVAPGMYYVRVRAANAYGEGAPSNVVPLVVAVPAPPRLDAHVDGRHVALSWTPGSGSAPAYYVLAIGTSPGAANLGAFNVGTGTALAADSPVAGQFFVRVYAVNGAGATPSNEVTLAIP